MIAYIDLYCELLYDSTNNEHKQTQDRISVLKIGIHQCFRYVNIENRA